MKRAVVNVSTDSWVTGQQRLKHRVECYDERIVTWTDQLPFGCPPHRPFGKLAGPQNQCVPYAFKGFAMQEAARDYDLLLWADACILPVKPMERLWERIERDGYWFARNGYQNYEWTADAAYPDLFPEPIMAHDNYHFARQENSKIPHVVATTFGLNVRHPKGRAFLDEYYRLASTTKAFCGPWQNSNAPSVTGRNTDRYAAPCGPPDVSGHRHDQSAASVIAWRLGFELTEWPDPFAYAGSEDERTILVANGDYSA